VVRRQAPLLRRAPRARGRIVGSSAYKYSARCCVRHFSPGSRRVGSRVALAITPAPIAPLPLVVGRSASAPGGELGTPLGWGEPESGACTVVASSGGMHARCPDGPPSPRDRDRAPRPSANSPSAVASTDQATELGAAPPEIAHRLQIVEC
jgi:hypothetical protein